MFAQKCYNVLMGRTKILLDQKQLYDLYHNKSMSPYKIGTFLNCSWATVANRLREFNIPLKNNSEARIKYERKDFNNVQALKAYMLGFRMGDLNVYKPTINSETIVVRCHTTQEEQVNVIKGLFSNFGHVTVSRRNGHMHVNCFLNQTFDFLIVKDEISWGWVNEDSKFYLPFIAGYTDAEGNFILNQGRARFKIDSYDYQILEKITEWLNIHNISFKFRQIYKLGDTQYINGIKSKYNGNLWRLNVNNANSLKKLILLIKPYLRHSIRIRQTKECLKNIDKRIKNGTIK
ncbi:MAG: LAGLIDADG family homing endonuclease [bacterium]|nr:LAGLIDADG family homing endonuclease [bacterium]